MPWARAAYRKLKTPRLRIPRIRARMPPLGLVSPSDLSVASVWSPVLLLQLDRMRLKLDVSGSRSAINLLAGSMWPPGSLRSRTIYSMTSDHYEGLADWYESSLEGGAKERGSSPSQLVGLLGEGSGRCLDVGCGTGARRSDLYVAKPKGIERPLLQIVPNCRRDRSPRARLRATDRPTNSREARRPEAPSRQGQGWEVAKRGQVSAAYLLSKVAERSATITHAGSEAGGCH